MFLGVFLTICFSIILHFRLILANGGVWCLNSSSIINVSCKEVQDEIWRLIWLWIQVFCSGVGWGGVGCMVLGWLRNFALKSCLKNSTDFSRLDHRAVTELISCSWTLMLSCICEQLNKWFEPSFFLFKLWKISYMAVVMVIHTFKSFR